MVPALGPRGNLFLIAGTYTPPRSHASVATRAPDARCRLDRRGARRHPGLLLSESTPLGGTLLALALGWASAAYIPEVPAVAGHTVTLLLALGGGLYSLGALAYALRRPDPWPRVFGYRGIFHALVVLAAICHFAAIAAALPVLAA